VLPDQLLALQLFADQLDPDQLFADQLDPDQLFADQLLPLQVLPFQVPPDQLLAEASSFAMAAELNGLPKMSCSPVSTTPSRVR